jgi:hypothetical protein
MSVIQADRREEAVHDEAIASLANETHKPLPVVRRVFEAEYARLKADARITDYLMLFTSKHARDVLMHMGG